MKLFGFAVSVVALLAGCGGSGSGSSASVFDDRVEQTVSLESRSAALFGSEGFTPFSVIENVSGSATYTGTAVYSEGSESGMAQTTDYAAIGSFSATANFGASPTVIGTINSFVEIANPEILSTGGAGLGSAQSAGAIIGSFTTNLEIREAFGDAVLVGDVDGSLTKSTGASVLFIDAPVSGNLIGADRDFLDFEAEALNGSSFQKIEVTAEQ